MLTTCNLAEIYRMPTPQSPINSGFNRDSTAIEVLDGINLSGKLAMVTGGYSGLGLETTRALASAGATVIVPARRPEHAQAELRNLAQLAGSIKVDALGKQDQVRAFAVHPGGIMTPLQRHLPKEEMIAMGWIDEAGNVNAIFKSPEQGASTSVWAATASALEGLGGVYCEDCNIAAETIPDSKTARYSGVDEHAINPEQAARLWTRSAELTGVNVF
jgi:hypothetical protein